MYIWIIFTCILHLQAIPYLKSAVIMNHCSLVFSLLEFKFLIVTGCWRRPYVNSARVNEYRKSVIYQSSQVSVHYHRSRNLPT